MNIQDRYRIIRWFWWLQRLMFFWVKSKSFPIKLADTGIDPEKPVCYVLKVNFFTDLFILDYHCQKLGLPRPYHRRLSRNEMASGDYLYLVRTGIFKQKHSDKTPAFLLKLVNQVHLHDQDIQLVPVSIFWGRNPGREEKSLLKLLFLDDEQGGLLQRLFTLFVHGRQVVCNFGKPVSIIEQTDDQTHHDHIAKKIRRVLRVHFRKQREAILGPNIYNHQQVVKAVLNSKNVREAIDVDADKKGSSFKKASTRSSHYIAEISARQSHNILRFFEIVLSWVWKKIYDGIEIHNSEGLRTLAEDHEIVYVPCHRSHMDYLLLGYMLYGLGLMPPHTAAGINLNFWPIGNLLRRSGAFFIRRTFAGNRLYGAVFNEYVHYLLSHGFPISYYPEGGRSRTGRMLQPKVGMLSMILQSAKRGVNKPIALVPVYVGYDKIMEISSYTKEMRGKKKQGESFGQLVGARKILRKSFGKVYVGFGEPIKLDSFLAEHHPGWNIVSDESGKLSRKLGPAVTSVSKEIVVRINAAAVMSPIGLFTTILLATPKHAMTEMDLLSSSNAILELLHKKNYSSRTVLVEGDLRGKLAYAEKLTNLGRFSDPSGDVIFISENERPSLSYYRNNTLHLFAIPSLIACFFRHGVEHTSDKIVASCQFLYGLIADELFLRWSKDEISAVVQEYIEAMIALNFLVQQDGRLSRPDVLSKEFAHLHILSGILHPVVEKYAIYATVLNRYEEMGRTQLSHFEEEAMGTFKRLSILAGTASNLNEHAHFLHFVRYMKDLGYLNTDQDNVWVAKPLGDVTAFCLDLLSSDIKQSILRRDGSGYQRLKLQVNNDQ